MLWGYEVRYLGVRDVMGLSGMLWGVGGMLWGYEVCYLGVRDVVGA